MTGSFVRRAMIAAMAFTVACGDSTGPNVQLTEEQVDDMMSALADAGGLDLSAMTPAAGVMQAVVTITETVECPEGGTANLSGSITTNDQTGAFSATFTQGFSGCKGTSETGRLWTFDGNPNITATFNGSVNSTTGAATITGSISGGLKFNSDLGTGTCSISVTMSLSDDGNGNLSGSMSGSICGRTVSIDVSELSG